MEQFSTSLLAGLLGALATGVGVVVDGVGWPLFFAYCWHGRRPWVLILGVSFIFLLTIKDVKENKQVPREFIRCKYLVVVHCTVASVKKLTKWRAVFWRQDGSKNYNYIFFKILISCRIALSLTEKKRFLQESNLGPLYVSWAMRKSLIFYH